MTLLFLEFVLLAGVVVVAGSFLVRYGDRIGELIGLGRTLAGMLLLATATSLPELAIGANAALGGAVDLAMGDVLGASLMNLLILAVLDISHHTGGRSFTRIAAAHALSATMSILLAGIVLVLLLLKSTVSLGFIGVGSVVLAASYALGMRLVYYDQRLALAEAAETPQAEGPSLRTAVVGYLLAAAAIFLAAPFLTHVADQIAEQSGLGRTFVGTTFVALCTTLPEAVTTMAALRMGALDLAVGNVFGSNSFNMLIVVAIDVFYPGQLFADLSPNHALTAAAVIVVTAVAVLGLLYRAEKRILLIEPDAALVILFTLSALGILYLKR